jgi:uncharacterized protein (DUF302 family)
MKWLSKSFLVFALTIFAQTASAEQLILARVKMSFPETMLKLQESVKLQGYKLSRVQRVDIGLTKSGYKTDKYRVVFFGKPKEIQYLTNKYPEMIPYLPLKIAIYAEEKDTMLIAYDPDYLFPHDNKELDIIFKRWEKDILEIIKRTQEE